MSNLPLDGAVVAKVAIGREKLFLALMVINILITAVFTKFINIILLFCY